MERHPSRHTSGHTSSVAHTSVNPVGLRVAKKPRVRDSRDVIVVTAGQHDSSDSSGEKKPPCGGLDGA